MSPIYRSEDYKERMPIHIYIHKWLVDFKKMSVIRLRGESCRFKGYVQLLFERPNLRVLPALQFFSLCLKKIELFRFALRYLLLYSKLPSMLPF